MNPSSTSNSSRVGPPWSLLTAVGILALLELAFRFLNPLGVLAGPDARELGYRGLVTELSAYGAPEVAIAGSSRARRAVLSPVLRESLAGRRSKLRVGNFALGGARAEETEVTVRRLLEASPPPRLLVWPIAPRDLEARGRKPGPQVRYLWRPRDWWLARKDAGGGADAFLPDALRNEVARHSLLVRYRFAVRDTIERPPAHGLWPALWKTFRGRRGATTFHGELDEGLSGRNNKGSLRVSRARVERYVGKAYREPNWPQNYQSDHLERTIRAVKQAGVVLILVELPSHPLLEEVMPANTSAKLRRHLRRIAARLRVKFVPLEDLHATFDSSDFREQSHMNFDGARKYTRAIAPVVTAELKSSR